MPERKELREAREAEGLTQTDLAEAVGIDNTYMSHIEAGRKTPSPQIMGRIAAKLKRQAVELFRELAPTG